VKILHTKKHSFNMLNIKAKYIYEITYTNYMYNLSDIEMNVENVCYVIHVCTSTFISLNLQLHPDCFLNLYHEMHSDARH